MISIVIRACARQKCVSFNKVYWNIQFDSLLFLLVLKKVISNFENDFMDSNGRKVCESISC